MEQRSNSQMSFGPPLSAVVSRWSADTSVSADIEHFQVSIECPADKLTDVCEWLTTEANYKFATLIASESETEWLLRYVFYGDVGCGQVQVLIRLAKTDSAAPSISSKVHAADWHEREVEDLFGITFEGHPRLGDFVLHEEWPEGVNPMRSDFNPAEPYPHREAKPEWRPLRILQASGAFVMPIGPVYSDYAESAQFFLETVGEDVVRTTPRFFYKYRGVEKLAEGQPIEQVLLMAERFSGTSAFAHSLAFCQAVEKISGFEPNPRVQAIRVLLAELERLRHHVGAIAGICRSTALAVSASQASILEEELLRLSCQLTGHRYLFGANIPGGLSIELNDEKCLKLKNFVDSVIERLAVLLKMLRSSSSFLDRLEEVGVISEADTVSYGLVGPVARASGVAYDLRKVLPYGAYGRGLQFNVPVEFAGDGYARLRILFSEVEESAAIIRDVASNLPRGQSVSEQIKITTGEVLSWVEAPLGAAFHWIRIDESGMVGRYRITPPSFTNWHGFHLAAENFAFQDFPIILATFGLSCAECDR
ncbi:MAG: NADH-quinone oxidoreductase subunit C [Desulfomonilaceae bacterium]